MLVGGGPTPGHFFLLRQKEVTKKKATAEASPAVGGSPIISTISRVEIPTRWRSNMVSDNSRLTAEITCNAYDGVGQLQRQLQPQPQPQPQPQTISAVDHLFPRLFFFIPSYQ
ncbi:hypothetical protein HNR39_001954 [Glaciimonas immobilis]|uniref:Uncharacterized protein n=1 Tax=Glaciimonas immobilis TaxID=728004 RepID=A0A840RUH5_9BURK|nr:hypothetical protein [Glaciimonas immobilis]